MADLDMATALDLSLDDAQEAKFTALKNLNAKKVKYLMVSIDTKDKEIAKLKVLGKDNRRTQMIQALRNKLREQELVTDVIKQELSQKAELTTEEVNGLIIRKTLGGPKRFRPLTREELENQITDLEKKMAKQTGSVIAKTTGPSGGNSVSGSQANRSVVGARSSSASQAPSRGGRGAGTTASNQRELAAAQQLLMIGGSTSGNNDMDLNTLAKLGEEVHNLRILLDAKDGTIEQQKEDISRLRARNSELRMVESDYEQQEREERAIRLQCDALKDELEMMNDKLIKTEESLRQMEDTKSIELEESRAKLDGLQEHCEKLLKSNSSLLKKLADVERDYEKAVYDLTRASSEQAATSVGGEQKDRKITELEAKVLRLDEKRKALEQQCSEMARESIQMKTLNDKLREANITIRELEKDLESMTKDRDREKAKNKELMAAGTGGGGGDNRAIDDLFKENKALKQALATAMASSSTGGNSGGNDEGEETNTTADNAGEEKIGK